MIPKSNFLSGRGALESSKYFRTFWNMFSFFTAAPPPAPAPRQRAAPDARAERRVAVRRPLKLIIDNYPEGQTEELEANNHPQKPEMGTRRISFSRELWIEEGDFAEGPPKGDRR